MTGRRAANQSTDSRCSNICLCIAISIDVIYGFSYLCESLCLSAFILVRVCVRVFVFNFISIYAQCLLHVVIREVILKLPIFLLALFSSSHPSSLFERRKKTTYNLKTTQYVWYLLISLALRWYGSMASKCDSFIFSNLATPNVNKSCLHFVIEGSPFDRQYLLTSFANIEYKCDIWNETKRKEKKFEIKTHVKKRVRSMDAFWFQMKQKWKSMICFCFAFEWVCL